MKAPHEISEGDVCSRCGATVRPRSGLDGILEGGVDSASSGSVTDGSLESGIDLDPLWDCDCAGKVEPQVNDR
jgi:hypothetical protein